jgi:hypothetical protein
MVRTRIIFFVACLLTHLSGFIANDRSALAAETVYLDQGWSKDERIQFYFTTQGSQLVPYDWFLALESADSYELLRRDSNLERLRFIPHPKDQQRNPDSLPIGFVKDDSPSAVAYIIKQSYLGPQFKRDKFPTLTKWLGLTCAACHTTEVHSGDKRIRIDGGPSLADAESFLKQLSNAVKATATNPEKMTRFAKRVLDTSYNKTEEQVLQEQLVEYSTVMQKLVRRSEGTHPYGMGRLDAFGSILNEICETSLEIPENHFPSDAPASYPFLWDTPKLDWVQWNGSIGNPIARNVGEVLGVFGQFRLKPEPPADQFRSTAHIRNLFELEQHVIKLKSPPWPAEFGKIDAAKAEAGKKLYAANCAHCHVVPDQATGKFPTRTIAGREYIKTVMIPVGEIGTDPMLVGNFMKRMAKPGVLASHLKPPLATMERVPRAALLSVAVGGIIHRFIQEEKLKPDEIAELMGHRPPDETPPNPAAYKARPMDGIWATAPYLHNGSVPNLYELLLPSSKRSKSFFVGNRQFDTKLVGFVTTKSEGAFEFKIATENGPIPGNSNAGHEGHGPGEKLGFTETFENGSWREFTDAERWALIEYMKTLNSESTSSAPKDVEQVPADEAAQINDVVASTIQQLKNRYPDQQRVLRAVHAKDHGCVQAVFEVLPDLDPKFRVGVFAEPGRRYDAWIRFSNAATLVLPDDNVDDAGKPVPGSRGMAIKLLGVSGTPLVPPHGALTQDFLLVNHPVFAFANVEDYQVLSKVVANPANRERPDEFFKIQIGKGGAAAERAKATLSIVGRIRAANVAAGAYQPQPASPVDCRYFGAAPFLFGDRAMKYGVLPVDPPAEPKPNVADPNYLRNALIAKLAPRAGSKPVVMKFQIQLRDTNGLDVPRDIENASTDWSEAAHPFVTVATITIPPQDFDAPERRALCENLFFTPWHGIQEHRPLGGINRMRKAVYEASSGFRHLPKEPAAH